MIPGALALASAGAAGAYALGLGGPLRPAIEVLVPLGLAILLGGLVVRWPGTIVVAVALIGAAYVCARSGHEVVDGWAVAVGVALLVAAELASWSIEHDERFAEERAVLAWRVGTLLAIVAAAALLDVLVVAAAAVSGGAGVAVVAAGVAAAVTAVALVLRLARAA